MVSDERVYIGPVEAPVLSFDNTSLESVSCENSVDVLGNELITDIIEVSVFFDDEDNVLRSMSYGTPIVYKSDGNSVGTYYLSKIERTGKTKYMIHGTSLIGLLEKEDFYGGMYDGDPLDQVIEDILITNGIDNTRYDLYRPNNPTYANVTKRIFLETPTYDFFKYRVHSDFVAVGVLQHSTLDYVYDDIEGLYNSLYSVRLYARSDDNFTNVCYGLEIVYGTKIIDVYGSETEVRLFGAGSRFVVDVDPLSGLISVDVEYVKYRSPSTTGTFHYEEEIELYIATSGNLPGFAGAFGGFNHSTAGGECEIQKTWNSNVVYNADGLIVKDSRFAIDRKTGTKYVFNAVGNTIVEDPYYIPYGESIGTVGDLTRCRRDLELMKSIHYASEIDSIRVYGWLKAGTKREALHEILFANNLSLVKSERNEIVFTTLPKWVEAEIDSEDMYDGGKDSEVVSAKSISVTEHGFTTAGISTQVLFDNSESVMPEGDYVVVFQNAPIYGTPTAEGITIKNYNCNAAIVSGKGTISGTPYIHSRSNITIPIEGVVDGSDVSVSDIGLITSVSSDSVLKKLAAYYSGGVHVINNGLIYRGERCGMKYGIYNPFEEKVYAYLTKCSTRTSTFVKADTQFVSGFVPVSAGGYANFEIITYGNEWIVPDDFWQEDDASIRLNLIGSGHDGVAGEAGKAGDNGEYTESEYGYYYEKAGKGGDGGKGGEGGDGGDIFSVTITDALVKKIVVSGSGFNTVVKTYNSSNGLIQTYSSYSGGKIDGGFLNPFDGLYYGAHGEKGMDGGKGGYGSGIRNIQEGWYSLHAESGENVGNNVGGSTFTMFSQIVLPAEDGYYAIWNTVNSGGGGGASGSNNGGDSEIRTGTSTRYGRQYTYSYGAGGKGADGSPTPPPPTYGCGGNGGHGGAGGGGGTVYSIADYISESSLARVEIKGTPGGAGGSGGEAGRGAEGCLIIYY